MDDNKLIQSLVSGEMEAPTAEIGYLVGRLKSIVESGNDVDAKIFELRKQLQGLEVDVHSKRVLASEYQTIIKTMLDMSR